jgi:hypothetical protein
MRKNRKKTNKQMARQKKREEKRDEGREKCWRPVYACAATLCRASSTRDLSCFPVFGSGAIQSGLLSQLAQSEPCIAAEEGTQDN